MLIPPEEVAALIAAENSLIISNDTSYACLALVLFEYIITLDHEVDFLWKRKWRVATGLFAVTRYATIGILILTVVPQQTTQCNNGLVIYLEVLIYLLLTVSAATSAIRVFALLPSSFLRAPLSGVVFGLGLAWPVISVYITAHQHDVPVDIPFVGQVCTTITTGISDTVLNKLNITIIITPIVTDFVVVIVTWYKTYRQVKQASSLGIKSGFSGVLLKDGSVYFLLSMVFNIIGAIPSSSPVLETALTFTFFLQPLLITRFLINLKKVDTSPVMSQDDSSTQMSNARFRVSPVDSIISNMGAPMDYGNDVPQDKDFGLSVSRSAVDLPWKLDGGDFDRV